MCFLHFREGDCGIATFFRLAFKSGECLVNRLEVGENQLGFDCRHVAGGVDRTVDVNDVVVLKDANDFADGVGFTNSGEELIPEALALTGSSDNPGNVDEVDGRGEDPLGPEYVGEYGQSLVRYRDHADIGFDCGKGVVRGQDIVLGECIKEGGLADVG